VEIGLGLDQSLRLSRAQERAIVQEAARQGYASLWSNAIFGFSPFQTCSRWSEATAEIVDGGLETGILVIPAPLWTAATLAVEAATVGELSGGRFVLGIGSNHVHSDAFRKSWGLPPMPPIAAMRDYLHVLRGLLDGETMDYAGKVLQLHGVRLNLTAPRVPLYLAALGEQMLRLAGALADGVALNWASAEQVAWSREHVAEGARRAGRDPAAVRVVEYIRVCVDDDVDNARRMLTRAVLGYALAKPGESKESGYRGHFGRMGFDEC
jgi:alkanesulfonate monooxygenase SsuD/methylene tetrahydromethanopterin reductase-like flavin-dependent oxidoreductase (luciferase family)